MEGLFKVYRVYRDEIPGRNEGDPKRPKVELTLCYYVPRYSSTAGFEAKHQYVTVTLFDSKASDCQLEPGQWVLASLSLAGHDSREIPGKFFPVCYLDNYIPTDVRNL